MQSITIILIIAGLILLAFIVLATMGFQKKKSFVNDQLASLTFQGILLSKQAKTYHGVIGLDERNKKLIIIKTSLAVLKTYIINFDEIISCELITGIGPVSNNSGFGITNAELKILVKNVSNPSHRFVFYEKGADNFRLSSSLAAQAEHWRDVISVIISTKDEKS